MVSCSSNNGSHAIRHSSKEEDVMYRNIIYLMLIDAIISSISFAHHAGTSYHGNITGCGQYNASGYWYVNESFNWSGASIGSCLTMANNTDSATIIDGGRFDITH